MPVAFGSVGPLWRGDGGTFSNFFVNSFFCSWLKMVGFCYRVDVGVGVAVELGL